MSHRAFLARASVSDANTVLYFAYGSNLDRGTFEGTRAMKPRASTPCVLPGYQLAFNVPGLPYVEPSFASVRVAPADAVERFERECHGVAHEITEAEWARLVATEGSYDVVDVDCVWYDGAVLKCRTLTHRTMKNFGERAPSARYANLLRNGSRFHGLDAEWIEYLDALEVFEPVDLDPMQRVALAMSVGPTLLAAAPIATAAAGKQIANGDGRRAVIYAFLETQDVAWRVQNEFFEPWIKGNRK